MPESYPFAAPAAEAFTHEAVFGARYPSLLLRTTEHLVCFREGEFRTSDPALIAFLCGVVRDEERANKGVWIKQLPIVPAPTPPIAETSAPSAATAPRPKKAKRS